jgi:predicted transcriptional regulator
MPRKNSNARTTTARRPKAKRVPEPQADTEPATTSADDRVWQALRANPGTTAAEIAVAAGVGRSTATKALARLATEGSAVRTSGPTPRAADRWQAADEPATDSKPPVPSVAPDAPTTAKKATADTRSHGPRSTAGSTTTGTKSSRLRPGELHGMVEDFLTERPNMEFTPGDIGRKLNRSSGAVANALVKLTEKGVAALVCDRPRKYQAASDAGA